MEQISVSVGEINFNNRAPFVLIGGINVLESRDLALRAAEAFTSITRELDIPYVFKASFDKANRSSIHSFRGPGLDQGLEWLAEVKQTFQVPILTDVHEPDQAAPAAEVADILQLPAFLSRQTDLVTALARTKAAINVKKAQFLAPHEMQHIATKIRENGNQRILLCERGTSFGYNNLVVDMLGFGIMKKTTGLPIIFDVTHSLQLPGGRADSAGGRREQSLELASAGLATGIAGLFLEAHPNPEEARCDGPSALPLELLKPFLERLKDLDQCIKSRPDLPLGT